MPISTERNQINLRTSDALRKLIDAKRIALSEKMDHIPSRSDVLRLALAAYLGQDLSASEVDQRRSEKKSK